MACLSLQVTSVRSAILAVTSVVSASVVVAPVSASTLSVTPTASAVLDASQAHPSLLLMATPLRQASLMVTPVIDDEQSEQGGTQTARLTIVPVAQAALSAIVPELLALQVRPVPITTAITLTPVPKPRVGLMPAVQAALSVAAKQQTSLIVGEVCSVNGGVLTVLAASDGPLRTREGGYILLDPSREPD